MDCCAQHRTGRRQVDQIAAVRDDRGECPPRHRRPERTNLFGGSSRPRHWFAFFVKI